MARYNAKVHLLIFVMCFIYQFCVECSQKVLHSCFSSSRVVVVAVGCFEPAAFQTLLYHTPQTQVPGGSNTKSRKKTQTFAQTVISADILLPRCLIPMQLIFCFNEGVVLHAGSCSFSTVPVYGRGVKVHPRVASSWFQGSHWVRFCFSSPSLMLCHQRCMLEQRHGYNLSHWKLKAERGVGRWVTGRTHQALLLLSWLCGIRISPSRSKTTAPILA